MLCDAGRAWLMTCCRQQRSCVTARAMQVGHFMDTDITPAASVLTQALFPSPHSGSRADTDALWSALRGLPEQLQADIVASARLPLCVQLALAPSAYKMDALRIAVIIANRGDGLKFTMPYLQALTERLETGQSPLAQLQSMCILEMEPIHRPQPPLCTLLSHFGGLTALTLGGSFVTASSTSSSAQPLLCWAI